MTPQAEYFTDEELLEFCFRIPTQKAQKKMLKETYDGISEPVKGIYPERSVKVNIERHHLDAGIIVLIGSHCVPEAKILGSSKTFSGANKREFIVLDCLVNDKDVRFETVLEELLLRPAIINSITVLEQAGFEETLKLEFSQDCIFSENPVITIESEKVETEEGKIVHVFQLLKLSPKATETLKLVGIGTAETVSVIFDLGVSYADF